MASGIKRVVGIDPGSYHLGIGCIEARGSAVRLIFAETIHAPKGQPLYPRLRILSEKLSQLLAQLAPEEIAIEDTFHGKNARSAFTLGIARGVAIAACLKHPAEIFEYAPTLVKSVVTGSGRADKIQVAKMVRLIVGQEITGGFDATDAVAVAICHANTMRVPGLRC